MASRIFILLKTISLALVVACAASRLTAAQGTDPVPGAAAQVRALEYKWAEAQGRKDNLALDALFDNALVFVEYDGTLLSKAEYLIKIRMASPTLLEVAIESMTLHTFGNTVIVVGIYHEKGVEDGHAYLHRRRFVDTWEYKAGNWVCIAAAAMPMQR